MKESELYERAREELTKHGWHKGSLVDPVGGKAVCLYGACFLANGAWIEEAWPEYEMRMEDVPDPYILELLVYEEEGVTVPGFNDRDETSLEDILLMLKKAETKAREKEDNDTHSLSRDDERR